MSIRSTVKSSMLSLLSAVLFAPTVAVAQPTSELDRGQPWADACEIALANLVRREHPHAETVQTLADTEHEYQASNAETGVAGDGQYLDGDGRWHRFSFTCVYNIRYGGVSSITYDVYDVGAPGGAPHSAGSTQVVFTCDNGIFFEGTLVDQGNSRGLVVIFPEAAGPITLPLVPSGSGSQYNDGDLMVWIKGNEALVERGGQPLYTGCRVSE